MIVNFCNDFFGVFHLAISNELTENHILTVGRRLTQMGETTLNVAVNVLLQ